MMGYYWGSMMDSWDNYGLFGGIMMIVFWILVIVAVIWLMRYLGESTSSGTRSASREKTPLEILKERYAKGEIKKEEFEEKKKDLS